MKRCVDCWTLFKPVTNRQVRCEDCTNHLRAITWIKSGFKKEHPDRYLPQFTDEDLEWLQGVLWNGTWRGELLE